MTIEIVTSVDPKVVEEVDAVATILKQKHEYSDEDACIFVHAALTIPEFGNSNLAKFANHMSVMHNNLDAAQFMLASHRYHESLLPIVERGFALAINDPDATSRTRSAIERCLQIAESEVERITRLQRGALH